MKDLGTPTALTVLISPLAWLCYSCQMIFVASMLSGVLIGLILLWALFDFSPKTIRIQKIFHKVSQAK